MTRRSTADTKPFVKNILEDAFVVEDSGNCDHVLAGVQNRLQQRTGNSQTRPEELLVSLIGTDRTKQMPVKTTPAAPGIKLHLSWSPDSSTHLHQKDKRRR